MEEQVGYCTASEICVLPDSARYSYLVKESARKDEVWTLWDGEGWFTFTDSQGRELAPVWPNEKCAQEFRLPAHTGCTPRKMSLDYWMDNWLTRIMNLNVLVSVFPTPDDLGRVVSPVHIMMDVRAEVSEYNY